MSDIPPTRQLLLIRHSKPETSAGIPARLWPLSDEGRQRCAPLARQVAVWAPRCVVTSDEPKACETGTLVATHLGVPTEVAGGLHEHRRDGVPLLGDKLFLDHVKRLFEEPDEVVFGQESATQALARFSVALAGLLRRHPEGNLAVVTHGTVLSLYLGAISGVSGYAFWSDLGLPALVVLGLPELRLVAVEHAFA